MDRKCKSVINIVLAIIVSTVIGIIAGILFKTNFLYFRFPVLFEIFIGLISALYIFGIFGNDTSNRIGVNSSFSLYLKFAFFADFFAIATGVMSSSIALSRSALRSYILFGLNIGFLSLELLSHFILFRYMSGGRSCKTE